jgi:hypothetical protein
MRVFSESSIIAVAVLGAVLAGPAVGHAAFVNKCAYGKEKCVSAKAATFLKCHVYAELKGVLNPDCLAKASLKFDSCFSNLEAKYLCFTTGDAAAIETKVDNFVAAVVAALDPASPPPTINRCSAAKKKCVSAKATGLLACYSKAAKRGTVVDPVCLGKAQTKFGDPTKGCFAKIEAKYGASCLTLGDTAAVETQVDNFAFDVAAALEPVCGNNIADVPFEGCDGTDDGACPGLCRPPGDLNECQCPVCGDHDVNQASEQCDRNDAAACPGHCALDCTCATCGNNVTEPDVEQCDGTEDSACPGLCQAPGGPNECQCAICGDGDVNQVSEACDGTDDAACPGMCLVDCSCAVCGNNVTEVPVEACDGSDDANCPGLCVPPSGINQCQCAVCGDNEVNQVGEECDGADDAACPGTCLGDCTCQTCGNNQLEGTENCDGTDDASCPGMCLVDCTCP